MGFPIQREKNTFQKFPCYALTICAPRKIKNPENVLNHSFKWV